MRIYYHKNDLDKDIIVKGSIAIDTEAMGLVTARDRLCSVQLSTGDGNCHVIHMEPNRKYHAPRLTALLNDPTIIKIFHYARFDFAILKYYLGAVSTPLYCTKIASRLTRTYTDKHGLKDLCADLLGIELSKEERLTDWGSDTLTEPQLKYAATDVLHLHQLKEKLDQMLLREGRTELAQKCFDFIPTCVELDLQGWDATRFFNH